MENRIPPGASTRDRLDRPQTIRAPARDEGIGNALRAAFDPGSYRLPDDMERLLGQMNR